MCNWFDIRKTPHAAWRPTASDNVESHTHILVWGVIVWTAKKLPAKKSRAQTQHTIRQRLSWTNNRRALIHNNMQIRQKYCAQQVIRRWSPYSISFIRLCWFLCAHFGSEYSHMIHGYFRYILNLWDCVLLYALVTYMIDFTYRIASIYCVQCLCVRISLIHDSQNEQSRCQMLMSHTGINDYLRKLISCSHSATSYDSILRSINVDDDDHIRMSVVTYSLMYIFVMLEHAKRNWPTTSGRGDYESLVNGSVVNRSNVIIVLSTANAAYVVMFHYNIYSNIHI